MQKFFLVIFSLLLIFFGIYGTDYFAKLRRAKTELGKAMLLRNAARYDEAIDAFKNIAATYPNGIVKAPALFLLADTYEKQQEFKAALETHRLLISHRDISPTNDWLILSIIAVSNMYRNDLLPKHLGEADAVNRYIYTIESTLRLKREHVSVSPLFRWDPTPFISLQDNLVSLMLNKSTILQYLETELAFLYLKARRYDDALAIFQGLNTNAARFGMAQVFFETGDYRRGINILKDLTAYDTTGKISMLYLDWMYRYADLLMDEQRAEEAVEIYGKIVSLAPDSLYAEYASYTLADHYYRSGDSTHSLKFIDTILTNTIPLKDEEAYLLMGFVYYDARDFYRARRIFGDFPTRFPDSTQLETAKEWKAMSERSIRYFG